MGSLFCEISKYLMIIWFALYTWSCYFVLAKKPKERQAALLRRQNVWMFLLHLDGYLVLLYRTRNQKILLFYAAQVVFFLVIISSYRLLYAHSAQLLVNNMCMLLAVGFLVLSRLSYEKAVRQFTIAVGSVIVALGIPYLIKKIRFIRRLTWLYAVAGLVSLIAVAALGAVSYGAKLSFTVAGIALQPSEFVKIIFVFFVAGMLSKSTELLQVLLVSIVASIHIIILVLSKDLGSALIFSVTYIMMLYVASRNFFYLLGGLAAGVGASVLGYSLFAHVRTRIIAWKDPFSVIENQGYQITQSLFAIGTGGWFGMGLYEGAPNKIPVVEADFIFSAISEELGCFFSLCLILICISCFVMFMNIAMQIRNRFYQLVALGLGIVYGFQVFLTIGGVIKFIPLTGVTLPLVSYGGTSVLTTFIMFAIIQGLYIMRKNEG